MSACILCQSIGAMCSYLFIVKTELPTVLQIILCPLGDDLCLSPSNPAWYFNMTYILLTVTGLIIVPLSSLKHIGFLGYTSTFSIMVMTCFVIVVVGKYVFGTELFPDAIAAGAMLYEDFADSIQNSTNADGLKLLYLLPANATHLLKETIYIKGHISKDCVYNGNLPKTYCKMEPQRCEP